MDPTAPTTTDPGFEDAALITRVLTIFILLTGGFGIVWSGLMATLGLRAAAVNTMVYVVLSGANLWYLRRTGRYDHSRTIQLVLILLNPLSSHVVFGGFVASGFIILSAFIAPVGALVFHHVRAARVFFGLFVLVVILAGLLEAYGYVAPTNPGKDPPLLLFMVNLPVIALVIFLGYEYFLRQRRLLYTILQDQNAALSKTLEALKKTQRQLVHAEKMASLGQLTAGIAHEIKNPLNFVNNFAEVNLELAQELREALARGAAVDELLADLARNEALILQHGQRADGIVRAMMQHASGAAGQREPTDINALVSEYIDLAYHGKRARVPGLQAAVERDLGPEVGAVELVPQEIGRVLLNLLSNAFDAVYDRAQEGGSYHPVVRVSTRRKNGEVEIRVQDNGPGVPPAARDRVFEPFFTTKPTGTGTGLGLSLSYDTVVQGHGGSLSVESDEGDGATFIVTLPAGPPA